MPSPKRAAAARGSPPESSPAVVVPLVGTSPVARAPEKPASSLAVRAYIEIRARILKGELPVGEAVSRRKLAADLGISVLPVTEALQQLEAEGLLESRPRVGTRVRVPTREDAEDRALLREALECQSARLFAERATKAEKEMLRRLGRQMDQLYAACETGAIDRNYLFSVNTYHMNLHLRIAECARCRVLRDAIETEQVLVFSWLYETAVDRRKLGSDFHSRLAEALSTGTPAQAEDAMRLHIRVGLADVLAKLESSASATGGWRSKRRTGVM